MIRFDSYEILAGLFFFENGVQRETLNYWIIRKWTIIFSKFRRDYFRSMFDIFFFNVKSKIS